jgi:translation initiation factor 2B subunit (eIF-2B alpha/beta/delta family)
MPPPAAPETYRHRTEIHPKVEALVLLFQAKGIHAARSGREVMEALAAVSADSTASGVETLGRELEANMHALIGAMPAYAPPSNVMQRIQFELDRARSRQLPAEDLRASIAQAAASYREWSGQARARISAHAAALIPGGATVFTFTLSETVLTALREARKRGLAFKVILTESRPNNDGLSTARSLTEIGVEVELGIDAGAGEMVRRADLMLIGAEAILSDGSAICKVGTYPAALAASRARVPVYILVDSLKFHSISLLGRMPMLDRIEREDVIPEGTGRHASALGSLFDRTPAELITGLVTERGLVHPTQASSWMMSMPVSESLAARMAVPALRAG